MKGKQFQKQKINKTQKNTKSIIDIKSDNKRFIFVIFIIFIIMFLILVCINRNIINKISAKTTSKMQFNELTEKDAQTDSDNVKFMAYFLSGDKKLDGTQNRIGYSDTMYFDLNVSEGKLENAKIEIDSQNFYLETNLMSDAVVSQNYVSNNTKEIVLNDLSGNISKTIEGSVKSGDYKYTTKISEAIGNDISNYNRTNTITFTALYTDNEGNQTQINKKIDLNICWYGEINCEIPEQVYGSDNLIQKYNITNYLDTQKR